MTTIEALQEAEGRCWFLTDGNIDAIAAGGDPWRLWPCLIRCGCGRLTVPAQDVAHFVGIIEREGSDYIRDVSLMNANLAERKLRELERCAKARATSAGNIKPGSRKTDVAVVGAGPDPWSMDFGGAFDGTQVISDADPGL